MEISDEEYPDKEREQVVSNNQEDKYNKEGVCIETKSIDHETGEVSYKSEYSYEYDNMGLFHINNKDYSIAQLIEELKNGTEVGECFKNNVYKLTLTYLMKFGGDE